MSLFDLHAGCKTSVVVFDETGARCSSCGVFWPLSRDRHGRPSQYRQPRQEHRP